MANLNPRDYIIDNSKFDDLCIHGIQRLQMSTALNGLKLELSTGMKLTAKANVLEVIRRTVVDLPKTKKTAFRGLVEFGFYKKRV